MGISWPWQNAHPFGAKLKPKMQICPRKGSAIFYAPVLNTDFDARSNVPGHGQRAVVNASPRGGSKSPRSVALSIAADVFGRQHKSYKMPNKSTAITFEFD